MKLQELLQLIKTTMESNLETVEDVEYGVERAWNDAHQAVWDALSACECLSGQEAVAHLDIPGSADPGNIWRVVRVGDSGTTYDTISTHATARGAQTHAQECGTEFCPYVENAADRSASGEDYVYVQADALED